MLTDENIKQIQNLIEDFKKCDGYKRSEEDIQAQFTLKILSLLGWENRNIVINKSRDSQKKKRPDILLKYENTGTDLLIIESKKANNKDELNLKYPNLSFVEQIFKYCSDAGLVWGVLTNFIEWRIYNSNCQCLYKEKKFAFIDLLWEDANKNSYVDLLSEEGLNFLNHLSFNFLIKNSGKIDDDPVFYPIQKDIEEEKIKEAFFLGIKKWRNLLIKHISQNTENNNVDIISQQILDRIIFIKICHDKGITGGQNFLSEVMQCAKKYSIFKNKFRQMDELFNSELFILSESDHLDIEDNIC